jgi:hypothetical protein
MKLIKICIIGLLISSLVLVSCDKVNICTKGEGDIISKTIAVSNFTEIKLSGAFDIVISQGLTQEVIATGHPNIIDNINRDVNNNTWKIKLENGCYKDYELKIYITVTDINSISLSGTGNITVNDFINQNDLSLGISGSGSIEFNAFDGSENLSVSISGSGEVSGNKDLIDLKKTNIIISGSGKYHGFPIKTDECDIIISGSGNCYVFPIEILDVAISGSGNVYYRGNPNINAEISGSGGVYIDN